MSLQISVGKRKHAKVVVFLALWIISLFVAGYDVYCSIHLQDVLFKVEQNPVGKWLIGQDQGSVALFMSLKCVGITLGLTFLMLLFFFNHRIAIWSAAGLAFIQVTLFFYLNGWWPLCSI